MGLTKYYDHDVICPHCGQTNIHNEIGIHIRYANQYSAGFRLFCNTCGYWTDVKTGRSGRVWTWKPSEPTWVYKQLHPDWRKEWKMEEQKHG